MNDGVTINQSIRKRTFRFVEVWREPTIMIP